MLTHGQQMSVIIVTENTAPTKGRVYEVIQLDEDKCLMVASLACWLPRLRPNPSPSRYVTTTGITQFTVYTTAFGLIQER